MPGMVKSRRNRGLSDVCEGMVRFSRRGKVNGQGRNASLSKNSFFSHFLYFHSDEKWKYTWRNIAKKSREKLGKYTVFSSIYIVFQEAS